MTAYLTALVVLIAVVLAIRLFMKRHAAQRQAHDVRMRAMAQATITAMKKKAQAEAAAKAAPAVASSAARDERDCPYCAEPILKKARVCKHCGRDVEPLA